MVIFKISLLKNSVDLFCCKNVGTNESSKFWLGILNELKNRGVQNALLFCVDGLTGFSEAISAAFPMARIQRCIVHQIRSSTKYVSYKDIKEFVRELKTVYTAVSEETDSQSERINLTPTAP